MNPIRPSIGDLVVLIRLPHQAQQPRHYKQPTKLSREVPVEHLLAEAELAVYLTEMALALADVGGGLRRQRTVKPSQHSAHGLGHVLMGYIVTVVGGPDLIEKRVASVALTSSSTSIIRS